MLSVTELNTERKGWFTLNHETVAVDLVFCLLWVGHNEGPRNNNVCDGLHERPDWEVPGDNRRPQSMSGCRLVYVLSAFESNHNELRQKTSPIYQRRLRNTSANISPVNTIRIQGTPESSNGTHFQQSWWRCPATHVTMPPEQRATR